MKIKDVYVRYKLYEDPSFDEIFKEIEVENCEEEIFIVVLTGGPCAGKTTTVNKAVRTAVGISNCQIFVAREAANSLKTGNITYDNAGHDDTFQRLIVNDQLTEERNAVIAAIKYKMNHLKDNVICLFDRSIMDGQAYFDDAEHFEFILSSFELSTQAAYDRVDKVVYLKSAAVGAVHAYTTSDGTKREETPQQAAALDAKIYEAWKGHPNIVTIDNSFRFNEKLDVAISHIFSTANIKIPPYACSRFIILTPDNFMLHNFVTNEEIFWDKTLFLRQNSDDKDTYSAIRIRSGQGSTTYNFSVQHWDRVFDEETEKNSEIPTHDSIYPISEEDVVKKLLLLDSHVPCLDKEVHTFYVNEFYCELSIFECNRKYAYLKVFFDVDNATAKKHIEKFKDSFRVVREVTFERKYCEYEIARTKGSILGKAY